MNQIAPGRAPVMTPARPYHQSMEGNTPQDGPPHATQQSAPYDAPPPASWGPPQAYPYPYPTPATAKSGRSLWIIFAGIVIAGALIAGAAFLALSGKDTPAPPAASPTAPASTGAPAGTADNSTCKAWRTTKLTMVAIPLLPAGWDWNTPNIDTYIQNRTTAISRALDLFEPKITPDPPQAADTAHAYITTRRSEIEKLRNHTFTSQDVVDSNAASAELDQVCNVTGG